VINVKLYRDSTGVEHRVVGSPIYELAEFIASLTSLAAGEYIGYDEDDPDDYDRAMDEAPELMLTKRELAHLCADAVEDMGRLDCIWCGTDTCGESYMVHNEIWEKFGPPKVTGCVCVGCLEDRMGRQLCPADFTDVPLNTDPEYYKSDRLRDRLGLSTRKPLKVVPAWTTAPVMGDVVE
jgi:hypothetical protein